MKNKNTKTVETVPKYNRQNQYTNIYLHDRSLYLLDTCSKSGGARLALWTQNINHGG